MYMQMCVFDEDLHFRVNEGVIFQTNTNEGV